MRHRACFLVIFLCYFQTKCSSNPTPAPKGRELIFSYHANIDVRNSACNHGFARWVLSGKLIAQNFNGSIVMKLEDLKTSIFNGQREALKLAHEKPIPEDAKVLLQPFILHKDDDGNIDISVEADEPLWSLNMKRGIGSSFQMDFGKIGSTEIITQEKTVYGDCEVRYKQIPSKEEVLEKITNYKKCTNKAWKHISNVHPGPVPKGFEPIQMKSVKTYKMKEENGVSSISNIYAVTQLIYQAMPKIPNTQHIDQYQEFDLLETKQIENEIDTSKLTNRKDIIFEYGEEPTNERRVQSSNNINNLNKQFLENYKEFEKLMNAIPLQNHNIHNKDTVENMFTILTKMNIDDLKNLEKEVHEREDVLEQFILFSLMPYIGSNHTMKYITSYDFENDQFEMNKYIFMRILAIFPSYLNFPLDDKLKELETLLNVRNSDHVPIRNGAILSFASVIGNGFKNGYISKTYAEKYEKLFLDKFLDNTLDYEEKMVYLLGLVNMAEVLKTDLMLEIITNSSESSYIRSLALTGFQKYLTSQTNKVFETFWPMVQNSTEQFDLRIRALDLLLSTNLTEEQFNTILQIQRGFKTNLYDKHIASYFITTLRSLQKVTGYDDAIGTLASKALKTEHFPDYSREWITGNYRFSYTDSDPNIGSYFQTRLIGEPKTSSFDVLHFTYNHFAMSFDMGTYDIYLKLHGVPKHFYKREFMKVQDATSIPELVELIKKFRFEMKSLDVEVHFELVVFVNGRAVFQIYDKFDKMTWIDMFLSRDLPTYLTSMPIIISYPLMDYTYIPSDLGTPLSIMNEMQDISSKEYYNSELTYRSSWYYQTWVESYNPIVDTTLASYKYYGDNKIVNLNITFPAPRTIILQRKNDSINWVWDKLIGTTVTNKEILEQYCPKCDTYNEISIDHKSTDIQNAEYFGVKLNITTMRNEFQPNSSKIVDEFLGLHQSNTVMMPQLKPILMLNHFVNYVYFFKKELRRGSYRTIDFYEKPGETILNFSLNGFGLLELNPFQNKELNFKILLNNKAFKEADSLSHWGITYDQRWLPQFKAEDSKLKFKNVLAFNLNYTSGDNNTFMICAERELLFPGMRADKFSILPVEPTTGKIKLLFGDIPQNESVETCPTTKQYILTEIFSATEDQTKKVKTMKQYRECEKDAEGLTFIPPTPACLPVFMSLSQYNHYIANEIQSSSEEDITKTVQAVEITRINNDKIKLTISKSAFSNNVPEEKYLEYIVNYPYRTPDPTSTSYNDFDILAGVKRSCTISSKSIKTFAGKFIPFDEDKSAVFVECINATRRGITVDKLSETNIGFKLWSNENVLTATVQENKLKVNLNGKELHENYEGQDDNFNVYFMNSNVIYIVENKLQLYYNTEYIYFKGPSMYVALSCGFCNYEGN